jgi:hypothetical protein
MYTAAGFELVKDDGEGGLTVREPLARTETRKV